MSVYPLAPSPRLGVALGVSSPLTAGWHLLKKVSGLWCIQAGGCQPKFSESPRNCPLQLHLPSEMGSGMWHWAQEARAIPGATHALLIGWCWEQACLAGLGPSSFWADACLPDTFPLPTPLRQVTDS